MSVDINDPETQRAVVLSLATGRSKDETARHLGMSGSSVFRILKRVCEETGTDNTTAALVVLAKRGELDEIPDPKRAVEPDLNPTTDVQHAIWRRLVVADLDWRTFRDLRQAYETICREGI